MFIKSFRSGFGIGFASGWSIGLIGGAAVVIIILFLASFGVPKTVLRPADTVICAGSTDDCTGKKNE